MAEQFDLYRDPGGQFLMVIQNDAVDALDSRVFASCVPSGPTAVASFDRLSVPFMFAETEYLVMLNLLGTARVGRMGTRVGNYADLRDRITRALDLLYSGI
jgi:hypothetical protein